MIHKIPEYKRLLSKIRKNNLNINLEKLNSAYCLAYEAHRNQYRSSGELYITHPIAVAEILVDMKLDTESIITALMHDTVEDSNISIEKIIKQFGNKTGQLVAGVTKLKKIEYRSKHNEQAENFRKLLLAISDDIRVLLVKLADRLHNMRTLCYIKDPKKRIEKSIETMDIYAPLAERMGINKVKNELQDLAFAELYPEIRASILHRISFLRPQGLSLVKMIEQQIKKLLTHANINASIHGREKTCFAIWKKMERKRISFEQLTDIIAFRILVENVNDCYLALGVIHTKYPCISDHFKDYISIPKGNRYQSLHTLVLGPKNRSIEIQIRTHKMHEIAELGIAAHWAYKQNVNLNVEGRQFRWIRELLSMLEKSPNPEEFIENTKIDISYDQVFCFTPKGDLIAIPKGSNPIDLAFAIHSDLGLKCIGVKINGVISTLNTILDNGDQVEIIVGTEPVVEESWIDLVYTGKAKAEIKKFLRNKQEQNQQIFGEVIYNNIIDRTGTHRPFPLPDFVNHSLNELYAVLGSGAISKEKIIEYYYHSTTDLYVDINNKPKNNISNICVTKSNNTDEPSFIKGFTASDNIKLTKCCYPIPGDKILAVADEGSIIEVHTIECPTLILRNNLIWLEVQWGKTQKLLYRSLLKVTLSCEIESIIETLDAIKVSSLLRSIHHDVANDNLLVIIVEVQVRGVHQLMKIIHKLRNLKGVCVERFRDPHINSDTSQQY